MSTRLVLWFIPLALIAGFIVGVRVPQAQTLLPRGLRADPGAPSSIPGITGDNLPRLNGSTSTIPLTKLIISRAFELRGELRSGEYGGNGPQVAFPLTTSREQLDMVRPALGQQRNEGTHEAYMRLLQTKPTPDATSSTTARLRINTPADLILVARMPSKDELDAAKQANVEFDVRPVALDAFVFLVNAKNPVTKLTLDQIRDIFAGRHTNWSGLGGVDAPIVPFTRNRNSGSEELMQELVMQGKQPIAGRDRELLTMGGVIDNVATMPNAIAYSVFYYEQVMMHDARNRLLAVNGVFPTADSIAKRRYPLVAKVYVVTRKDTDPIGATAVLRDWLLSSDGQRLVKESGYVPIKR